MNWKRLRDRIVNQYSDRPQITAQVDLAIAETKSGLAGLARLGHQFHLVEGPAAPEHPLHADFPRLVYHLLAAPSGYLVRCQPDLDLLGEGWFDTLDEAKHADGMGEQFKRGGIFPKSGLPALVPDSELTELDRRRRNGLE